MKKVYLLFLAVILLICFAGMVHTGIVYYNYITARWLTSAPAEVAFLLFIPYALAAAVVGIVWLIVFLVKRRRNNA